MGQSVLRTLAAHVSTMGDMENAACMADRYEKIQKLPDPVDGCPNFKRVPGFKVYCCGQPTIKGFENALSKVCGKNYPKEGPIIWINMRQEPNVYVNGEPICARPPNKIGEYAELGDVTRDIAKANEEKFLEVCEKRKTENGGKLKVVDINKKESEIEVKKLKSLSQVIEGLKKKYPGLVHWRVPVCNSAAPLPGDFDSICRNLVGTAINTPVKRLLVLWPPKLFVFFLCVLFVVSCSFHLKRERETVCSVHMSRVRAGFCCLFFRLEYITFLIQSCLRFNFW